MSDYICYCSNNIEKQKQGGISGEITIGEIIKRI